MRKRWQWLCLAIACVMYPASLWAEQGPEDVLRQMIKEIKQKKDQGVVVDYVDWDSAFNNIKPENRARMTAKSPAELKEQQKKFFTDPKKFVSEQIEAGAASVPAEQQAMLKANKEQISTSTAERIKSENERVSKATYEVGTAKIEGDKATVPLTAKMDSKTETHDIAMIKKDGKWLLPYPQMLLQPVQAPPQRPAQTSAAPAASPAAPAAPAKAPEAATEKPAAKSK